MLKSTEDALVLIVDDNPANLDLLTRLLHSHHYRVRAVPSGRLAIESAQLSPPDVILLDIKMPVMDGYETCRELKGDPNLRDIPVIFISALDDAWDKVKAFEVGGSDYLTKPFSAAEIVVRVQHQILLRHLQKKLLERTHNLEVANLRLLEMDKMKASFTAMLVHDLRSPLTAILTTLEFLLEKKPDSNDENLIHLAQRSAENMLKLTNDLLEVFRSSGSELPLAIKTVDVACLINEVVQPYLLQIQKRDMQLKVSIPDHLPEFQADEKLLERSLDNLLGNAIKYSPPGGQISITAEESKEFEFGHERQWLILRVKDSGRGIPAEKLPFVFDPFRQVTGRDSNVGFGLGLAIVQRIMAAHKGRAVAHSQEGVGSTFSLHFPLSPPD